MDPLNQEFQAIMQDLMQKKFNTRHDLWRMCNAETHRHKPDRTIYWIGVVDIECGQWRQRDHCQLYFYDRERQLVSDKEQSSDYLAISYDISAIRDELDAYRAGGFKAAHYLIKEVVWIDGRHTVHILRSKTKQSSFPTQHAGLDAKGEIWAVDLYNSALTNSKNYEKILILGHGKYAAIA